MKPKPKKWKPNTRIIGHKHLGFAFCVGTFKSKRQAQVALKKIKEILRGEG